MNAEYHQGAAPLTTVAAVRLPGHALHRRSICMALQAEVQTVTGAVHMLFLENVIGNAYQNLSNIVLTIRPTDLSTQQGVLIASHYDSLIGSPGAAC